MNLPRRLGAEFLGTFWLVFGGCGSAVLAAAFPDVGIGLLGVSLAFGLTVLTMAYAFGHISGGHFNPAVTVGLWLSKRLPARDVAPYIVTQVVAAIVASALLLFVANGSPDYSLDTKGLAANGYDEGSPGGYGLGAALTIELVLTLFFLLIILGATDRRAPKGFGPLAIGLSLTLIHLISIPVTNTSVNPARSTGPALFVDGAVGQLWVFWLAPLVGAVIAGLAYRFITGETGDEPIAGTAQDMPSSDLSIGELSVPPEDRGPAPGSSDGR
ncbi:aquaporin Z [soil metagenome]